jgi:hypothetical protein
VTEGYATLWGGYYNLSTGKVLEIQSPAGTNYYAFEGRPFNQGIAPVFCYDSDGTSYLGFINTSGKWVIKPGIYTGFMINGLTTSYRVFGETGVAFVRNASGKWGGIDKTGKTVIPFKYDNLYPYSFGLAPFSQNGKWGYLDADGNVAIEAQYVVTSGFGDDGYAVAYDGSKAFLIDSKGNKIVGSDKLDPDTYFSYDSEEDDVPTVYTPSEYVVIKENGKYGYGHISYKPALPEKSDMDSWAYDEVVAAIEEDLVPNYLQNLYLNNITRNEFCDLVVQAIEEVTDKSIEETVLSQSGKSLSDWKKEYPFKDTTNSNVIAAYALGIVQGRGSGVFDPYATITRQEAAAFLMRSAKVLGMDTSNVTNAGFKDSDSVGVWFTDAVNFVYQINVMTGTGNNSFTPLGTYTREQSYITIYRLFKAIVGE